MLNVILGIVAFSGVLLLLFHIGEAEGGPFWLSVAAIAGLWWALS